MKPAKEITEMWKKQANAAKLLGGSTIAVKPILQTQMMKKAPVNAA